jgi:hypothetical protein
LLIAEPRLVAPFSLVLVTTAVENKLSSSDKSISGALTNSAKVNTALVERPYNNNNNNNNIAFCPKQVGVG